ncbi:unnamed protein product [Brachionus calyciflorus]|uniref:Uncharacterized protein n=1 Tax=Brachionus calyciflorus TaxID=104777 RepID=A0A814LGH2_9BILA|nr:unnamed protein product [Brachionus calyciflorus]
MIMKFFLVFFSILKYTQSQHTCKCDITQLEQIESLNNRFKRIRIEEPNGFNKYSLTLLSQNKNVDCFSKSVYTNNKCISCSSDGWSDFYDCPIISCDKEDVKDPFVIETPTISSLDQNLFQTEQALAVYNFSPGKKICKYCQPNGQWSKFADTNNCLRITRPKSKCKLSDLIILEEKQLDYVRLHMETPEGFKIERTSSEIPSNSIIVYQSYLGTLAGIYRDINFEPADSFRKKYCRYCENGIWSEIESCIEFKCNKDLLTGTPQLFIIDKNQKVLSENQTFFKPNSVLAVYHFGSDKFCKKCQENGEWSKYSSPDLCKFKPKEKLNSEIRTDKFMQKLYKNETYCSLKDQKAIYLVLPNKKRVLKNSEISDKILAPSRSLIFTQTEKCSQCINGQWSAQSECEFNYCIRDEVENGVFKRSDMSLVEDSQNIFQPGTVLVEYSLTETTKLCRICELVNGSKAQWSKFSASSLCIAENAFFKNPQKLKLAPKFCFLNEKIEKSDYIFQNVVSWNVKFYLNRDPIPDSSMAVYLKERKYWCSKCVNGKWETDFEKCPIEFTIKKCDPRKVFNANYFVFASDGMLLSESEKNELIYPGEVMAVYEFGLQKFCKECHPDGFWSALPTYKLCNKVNWSL